MMEYIFHFLFWHTYPRSTATYGADVGMSSLQLQQHMGWKSQEMCQEYISHSKHALKEVGNTLAGPSTDVPSWGDHSPPTHNMKR